MLKEKDDLKKEKENETLKRREHGIARMQKQTTEVKKRNHDRTRPRKAEKTDMLPPSEA